MNKPKLIALSGHKGSGKDTMGVHLLASHGYRPISLAAPLKDMTAQLYDIPRWHFDSREWKDSPIMTLPVEDTDAFSEMIHWQLREELSSGFWTPRALLILEGSAKRSVFANYWLKKLINVVMQSPDNFVVTDMRYRNEADMFKILIPGSINIRVVREGHTILTQDASERDLDGYQFDRTIHNSGSLEQFHTTIDIHMSEEK